MLRAAVFSDTHANTARMLAAARRLDPDVLIHLGDHARDAEVLRRAFPERPLYVVRGNCDMRSSLSSALVCTVGGVCVFATHGHLYNVRYEPALDTLAAAAQDAGATVALFGHTHHACLEKQQGITLLNPGTIGRVSRPSYAVLTVAEGSCEAELKTLTQL